LSKNGSGIITAGYRRIVAAKGGKIPFLGNLLIGGAITLLVYFIEQSGLVERLLNRVLYVLLSVIGMLFRYSEFQLFTFTGILLDAVTVVVAAALWTLLRSASARILANLVLFVALIPLTIAMLDLQGILISGMPIVLGIIVAITLEATTDLSRKLLRRRIAEEKQEAEFSVIRHLAHNVKPGLQIARSPLIAVRAFLDDKGLLPAEVSRRLDGSPETVGEALNKAIVTLGQLNDIIDNTRRLVTREINRDDFREVELRELLEKDVFPLHAGKFRTIVEGGATWAPLHRESVVEAFNNLLRNAEVHGFPEYAADSEVRFHLRQTRKWIVIDYTNNGRPFPPNLTAGDFLTFGRRSADSPGEGLGGAWIGKVIEAHGGTFEIIRDSHPVHFRIRLSKRGY
jgi:hypothetical protein